LSAAGTIKSPGGFASPVKNVACGDRLSRLAEPHVVCEEKAPLRDEPLDACELVAVERPTEIVEMAQEARSVRASP